MGADMGARDERNGMARSARRWLALAGAIAAMGLAVAGCSDSTTAPTPTDKSAILLDKLLVSVVPGGSETITVSASDTDGAPIGFTIANDDPTLITAAAADSTITVTGLALGTAHVTITCQNGHTRVLPVQVYSQFVQDLGGMYVTYTDTFECPMFYSYRPIPPPGFHALSFMFGPEFPWPPAEVNGHMAVPVVKPKPGSDALCFTHEFSGPGYPYAVAWTPVAPSGYVAVGTFFSSGWSWPDSAVCIRADLTTAAPVNTLLAAINISSPAEYPLHFYSIDAPDAGAHPGAYLTAGGFINTVGVAAAADHPSAHILDVPLPTLAEAGDQTIVPRLTGYEAPPEFTKPYMARAMLVPCTLLKDPRFAQNLAWRVDNSPFYRLERQVLYKKIYYNRNNTSTEQTNSVLIRSGVTTTESTRIYNETQITVSAELGLTIKALSGKIAVTVSRTMGYETSTSISELQEKEVTTSINTPPFKAVAAWQEYNRYVLYRHNGTELEPVSTWEFGIDNYVTDEYPDS